MTKATHILETTTGQVYKVYLTGAKVPLWRDCLTDIGLEAKEILSLTPLEATEEAKEPEILSWKEAARHWLLGKEVEYCTSTNWYPIKTDNDDIYFNSEFKYRIKHVSPVVKEIYGNHFDSITYWHDSLKDASHKADYPDCRLKLTLHDNEPVKVEILKR